MNRYKHPSTVEMQREIEIFNRGVAEGSPVTYKRDSGEILRTTTRSAAFILSGHTPVIFVFGISGCVALNRVTPITAPSTSGTTALPDQPNKKDSQ